MVFLDVFGMFLDFFPRVSMREELTEQHHPTGSFRTGFQLPRKPT